MSRAARAAPLLGVAGVALVIAAPLLMVLARGTQPAPDTWAHLSATVLPGYAADSLILCAGVAPLCFALGAGAAWLCAMCEFPGRRWLEWTMILPLAYPPYILAYTYTGMLDFGGAPHRWLDAWFDLRVPIRSMGGAIVMLSLALFPYVYLLARTSLRQQSARLFETARLLGATPWTLFARVALPLTRPALIAGVALALMEALADYGTVQYFGVNTLSVGILRTWFGLGDLQAAAQLSLLLLAFVLALLVVERGARRRARYHEPAPGPAARLYRLRGARAFAACAGCIALQAFSFALPTAQLAAWALDVGAADGSLRAAFNSVAAAAGATALICAVAALLTFAKRGRPGKALAALTRFAVSGYAVPGVVIAAGVLALGALIDPPLAKLASFFGAAGGWALGGGFAGLMLAYLTRYIAPPFNIIDTALEKIPVALDQAARTLQASPGAVLARVHLPLMRPALLSALLLGFLEILKELPATLVLRPFNFDTLAVRAFELASDERLAEAAAPALMLVGAGVVSLLILTRLHIMREQ